VRAAFGMSHSDSHQSYWVASSNPPHYDSLNRNLITDVVVIGGGIVGVLTAYLLKQAGKKVVLLESRRLLQGVTGFTTAKLSVCHNPIYKHIVDTFGADKAQQYAAANAWAINWVESTAQNQKLACDFRRSNLTMYAQNEVGKKELEAEMAACQTADLNVTLTDNLGVPFPAVAGLVFPNQAYFHPLSFLLPLAQHIPGDDSYIFEDSRVIEVQENESCVVRTKNFAIQSQQVVVASHFPIYDPAMYFARLRPFRDYAIAFRLSEPVLPEMYVSADDSGYTYRPQPNKKGDLLIVSGGVHTVGEGGDTRQHYEQIEQFMRKHFKVKDIAYSWSTQDLAPVDKIPYIGKISPKHHHTFVATGFNGWGMAHGVVAAHLIHDLIIGKPNELVELYNPARFKPIKSAPKLAEGGVTTAKNLIRRILPASKQKVAEMKPGDAGIIETDQGKLAVYKDRQGKVHALSPTCTHMGCSVSWNSAEESWDCACHGSRFSPDGKVLHSPAVKDLEKVDLPES
jgi:glycine/D-amino acid oxidase-like deaminating enzyme/nitrite reductase/ring-hydroxylating ferredoxin subunit